MGANDFILKIKATGTDKDICDLDLVSREFKEILSNLSTKDRGPFALNVLCILCRNLEKVPGWSGRVDAKLLVALTIDCVRETRSMPNVDQVKTLACIYHIHKHVVKLNSSVPPELILKLSFMPFEYDSASLLSGYAKTYWNILADRMTYMERLKSKNSIAKLLPRITEDVSKVVKIYDTTQFCGNILTFLVKKLHYLYNETNPKDLQACFGEIFKVLQLKIESEHCKLTEKESVDLYVKFNDCFYVIAENASKVMFKGCILNVAVTVAKSLLRESDLAYNLDFLFTNGFCVLFENITQSDLAEKLDTILTSCSDLDKKQDKSMKLTYSFLIQILRLYTEFCINNTWKQNCNVKTIHSCLNIIYYLSTKKGNQFLKCDNCKVKSSLHDSLRLLFLIKYVPSLCINQKVDIIPLLSIYNKLVGIQHKILQELKTLGCANHEKCFRKLQTDVHNTAIILNKANYYVHSIKLFHMYVECEIGYFKSENDLKNISRALYNKSICELDCKLYVEALKDAYLSLVFSLPDGLMTEKYMSLVMDIKAKELKVENDENHDGFQLLSVLGSCDLLMGEKKYGNLKPFLGHIKFSELLRHEFSMYAKLWPSIVPIAGVWRSLLDLLRPEKMAWLNVENKEDVLETLYDVIMETPTVVRTIQSEYYSRIVTELLENRDGILMDTTQQQLVKASLLFLKAEYDMADASKKHEWKVAEPTMDPDQAPVSRTLPQEHAASQKAIDAVDLLSEAIRNIHKVESTKRLSHSMEVYQVWMVEFLQLSRPLPALQLAHVCLKVAEHIGDARSYVRSAGVIVSYAVKRSEYVQGILTKAMAFWGQLRDTNEALVFLCDAAIYHSRAGSVGVAARLLQYVQAKILHSVEKDADVNLDLAIGRLLEAQNEICRSSTVGTLSAVSNAQRHYLTVTNTASKWSTRRLFSLTLKLRLQDTSVNCCGLCRRLQLWRRARASGACASGVGGTATGLLYATITNTYMVQESQTRIDNRLKHILGLQPSNESQDHTANISIKPQLLTPRIENIETMLDNMVFKKTQTSPSLPCTSVYAFKMPDFYKHTKCKCYACDNPYVYILSCLTSGLEASTYFRAKETDIARNYFEGALKSFGYADVKIREYFKVSNYDDSVIKVVEKKVLDEFKTVQIDVLVEAALFELAESGFDRADDLIVRIHELMQEMTRVDQLLRNEVVNLMIASAKMRKTTKKKIETGLEVEMENLKLDFVEEPKTPIIKSRVPPKMDKVVVKNEELPNVKRKVIKLNLDEAIEEVKRPSRKAQFKIPVPITSKPVLENITPSTRRKPDILITKPEEKTPQVEKSEFFTPSSTPEQFFTPLTSIKTYAKKSLRSNIVKNLEAEFATPNGKENSTLNTEKKEEIPVSNSRSTRSKVDMKGLKRATSPGKLGKEVKTRSRLRNPVKFNVHEDK